MASTIVSKLKPNLLWMLLVFFFFFKQKTAYEMRISDWSSDVCSSDLGTQETLRATPPSTRCARRRQLRSLWSVYRPPTAPTPLRLIPTLPSTRPREIGRAACRERVGEYV